MVKQPRPTPPYLPPRNATSATSREITIGREGDLRVGLMTLGARVTSMRVALEDGSRREVVLGLPDPESYLANDGYVGATVGRVANRIRGASFVLDGVRHDLGANEGRHTLHGGPVGFDRREWTLVEQGARHVVLELVSEAGDQGFPGTLAVRASFRVDGPELRTTYTAVTDAPTVVNLTSHPYLNLGGPDGRLDAHRLTVHAARFLPVDEEGIPLGDLAEVEGTPFDLREPRSLGSTPGGFDHCWAVDDWAPGVRRRVAELEAEGLRLELDADQPGLQVFTGGSDWNGVALEPQHFPDSPHHPEWPSVVLRPGEEYRWSSVLRVTPTFVAVGAAP